MVLSRDTELAKDPLLCLIWGRGIILVGYKQHFLLCRKLKIIISAIYCNTFRIYGAPFIDYKSSYTIYSFDIFVYVNS